MQGCEIKYKEDEEGQCILMTSSAAGLESIIRGVAAENGLKRVSFDSRNMMYEYEKDPSRFPEGLDYERIEVGRWHIMTIQTDDGHYFNPGDILLQYKYNDDGESAEVQAAHFEEIKRTFHKVLEDIKSHS